MNTTTQNKMTKAKMDQLRNELNEALAKVCEKHGLVQTKIGNITYTDTSITTQKLTFAFKSDVQQQDPSLIKPESFIGRYFKSGGRTFEIKKANLDGSVSGETQRGKMFRIRIDQLLTMVEVKY